MFAPRYSGGLARAAGTINDIRAADARDRALDQQEQEMAALAAERAADNARQAQQLEINRGYLSLQTDQQMAAREADARKQEQLAVAGLVDSLNPNADPMQREVARQRLAALGIDVDSPSVGQVAAAAAAPPADQTAPAALATAPQGQPAAPAEQRPMLAQEDNAFNWISPVRPAPARMDIPPTPDLGVPQAIAQAPLQKLVPSAPSALELPSPEQAALAGGGAGLAGRPITMGALDATRALPGPGMGVPPAAPGLPKQAPPAPAGGSAPNQAAAPVPGVPAGPLGGGVPSAPPTPEVARWRLRRGDDVLMELDPAAGAAMRQQVVADWAAPLVASARTPEERRAASLAMDVAKRTVDAGEPTAKALEQGRKAYEFELEQANAMKRAGISAGARVTAATREYGSTGGSKGDYEVRKDDRTEFRNLLNRVRVDRRIGTELSKTETSLNKIDELLSVGNATADLGALTQEVRAMGQSGVLTNQDVNHVLNSGGLLSRFEGLVRTAIATSDNNQTLSSTLLDNMRETARALKNQARASRVEAATDAVERVNGYLWLADVPEDVEQFRVSAWREIAGPGIPLPDKYKPAGERKPTQPAQPLQKQGASTRPTQSAPAAPRPPGAAPRGDRIRRLGL